MKAPFLAFAATAAVVAIGTPSGATYMSSSFADTVDHVEQHDRTGGIQSLLAPGTKVPKIGPDAAALDYVRWARSSLDRGQDAEAELSLEWGQVRRRIDEEESAIAKGDPVPTYDAWCMRSMCKALRSIGFGDAATGRSYLVKALREFASEGHPNAEYSDPLEGGTASTTDVGARVTSTAYSELVPAVIGGPEARQTERHD